MKKLILLLSITIALFSFDYKSPTITQTQWEVFLDNSKAWVIAKAQGSADTSAKFYAMVSSAGPVLGKSQAYLETKMEEWYGSDWRNAGGPLHTACQIICAITLSSCLNNNATYTWGSTCEAFYRDCLRMCGV